MKPFICTKQVADRFKEIKKPKKQTLSKKKRDLRLNIEDKHDELKLRKEFDYSY